jgi:hypothetical protein
VSGRGNGNNALRPFDPPFAGVGIGALGRSAVHWKGEVMGHPWERVAASVAVDYQIRRRGAVGECDVVTRGFRAMRMYRRGVVGPHLGLECVERSYFVEWVRDPLREITPCFRVLPDTKKTEGRARLTG